MSQAWNEFHKRWPLLKPPQAVTPDTAARIAAAIESHDERVLLLGVTPPLAGIGDSLVAVEQSANMIANIWPGDNERRRAVEADWLRMEFGGDRFSAVIGDGSLNCIGWPGDYQALFARLAVLLRAPARFVVRFYVTPDPCESVAALVDATRAGQVVSIHPFRWRLGMAMAAEQGDANVAPADMLARFDAAFPDRGKLMRETGWTMDEIEVMDLYRGSDARYSFPTVAQIRATVPAGFTNFRLLDSGAYDLAERCPLVAIDWEGE